MFIKNKGGLKLSSYIHFTEEERERARNTDLVELLRSQGETLKRSGSEYEWLDGTQKVTIRGNLWFHQYERVGGDAVGFVRKFYNKEYAEAVQFLLDGKCGTIVRAKPKEIERKPFKMPKAYWNMNRVKDYLCNVRGIDEEVIQAFVDKKMIFESLDYHNAAFVGFDKNSVPRHANKRGILKGSTFKGNAEGSLDEFAFHWIGTNNKLFLFEAPIDMFSYICMNKENWKENSYAASCSISDRVLFQCLNDYPNINEVFIGYDNDFYGQRAAKRTQNKLDNMNGYKSEIIVPSYKDWNEDYLNADEEGSEINWVI